MEVQRPRCHDVIALERGTLRQNELKSVNRIKETGQEEKLRTVCEVFSHHEL